MKLIRNIIIFLFFTNFFNVSLAKDPSDLINQIVDEAASILSSEDPVESKKLMINIL